MTKEYVAGFFDGEGSITHNGKGYRITISQTNKRVLQEIKGLLKIGYIFKNRKRQAHWKESWVYYIAKQKDVYLFLQVISPFMVIKKGLAIRVFAHLKNVIVDIEKKRKLAQYRKRQALSLRKRGATYRNIGKELGIDWSYARRLILRQLKRNVK